MIVVGLVLVVLLLALAAVVLGVMRETVILRGDVKALSSLITHPPAPSFLGEALPAPAARQLPVLAHRGASDENRPGESHILAFLSPDCSGCSGLVSDIASAIEAGDLSADRVAESISFLVASYEVEEPAVARSARALGVVLIDRNAELGKACEVRHTPMLMQIRLPDAIVVDYSVGGGIEWIQKILQPRMPVSLS
jgi:hypothetical protein